MVFPYHCKVRRNTWAMKGLKYQNLKVDFHCYARRRNGYLATGSVENLYFSNFTFSMLQGETYLATIFKNGNGTKAMLHINRIQINDIFICNFFELLSQANKQSPHLLIKTTVQHTTKVKYLYHRSNL